MDDPQRKTPKSSSGFLYLADFVKKSKSIYHFAPSGGLALGLRVRETEHMIPLLDHSKISSCDHFDISGIVPEKENFLRQIFILLDNVSVGLPLGLDLLLHPVIVQGAFIPEQDEVGYEHDQDENISADFHSTILFRILCR
jgi:hypothetical protein